MGPEWNVLKYDKWQTVCLCVCKRCGEKSRVTHVRLQIPRTNTKYETRRNVFTLIYKYKYETDLLSKQNYFYLQEELTTILQISN
jgi:hypothetical protein